MDVLFQILLPNLKLIEGLERFQDVYTLEGMDYPQEPIMYRWGDHVTLIPRDIQQYVLGLFPTGLIGPDWIFLDVEGDCLDLWESEANGFEADWGGKRLDNLLFALLGQYDQWGIVFELFSDQIDGIHEVTVEECVEMLKRNLKRDVKREGFVAYFRK